MLNLLLSWKGCALLMAILALLFTVYREAHDPRVNRPATPQEKRIVKQGVTGWGRDFARHR
jgi:hypothetical protein